MLSRLSRSRYQSEAVVDGGTASGFRSDLEGLRGVAVVLIVAYHAGIVGFTGGYVGVDVFFVLSGFLITGLLIRELGVRGRIDLISFYARRARRVVPAAFVVLVTTLIAAALILSPIGFSNAARDVAAAALYVPNFLFASQTTDYLHPTRTSPVLHYWSLGVEEQFYLLWPSFLAAFYRVGFRTPARLAAPISIVVLGSVALSALGTPSRPSAAFFLIPTRMWELGLGSLLALAPGFLARRSPSVAAASGWLGLSMILIASIVFDDATSYPGLAAVVPVFGTALLIDAGSVHHGVIQVQILSATVMRFIGRISYSLYLWHAPLLIFGAFVLRGAMPIPAQVAAEVLAAGLLAAATYRWIENPLRRGRFIGTVPRRNLSLALAAPVALAAVSFVTGQSAIARFQTVGSSPSYEIRGDPLAGLVPARAPLTDGPLPENLTPPLLDPEAGLSWPNPAQDGCNLTSDQVGSGPCLYGDQSSATTVVLFGDSHAIQWFPALQRVAVERHWRLLSLTKNACPYFDVSVMAGTHPYPQCDVWRESTFSRISSEHPQLVIVASSHVHQPAEMGVPLVGQAATAALREGEIRAVTRLRSQVSDVAVIGDTPQLPFEPTDCLSTNPDHILRCAMPRDGALDADWLAGERSLAVATGAVFVDSSAWLCPTDLCPIVLGQFLVYRDTNHISWPFSAALASRLDAALP
jgi:peptidoglycan/LPS O-acetylase OafA/YrhL